MKTLEIKEVDSVIEKEANLENGVYLDLIENSFYFVLNRVSMFLCFSNELKITEQEKDDEEKEGYVSESFALKMAAVVSGKVKDVEL